jgi:hypothetical protein
MSVPAEAAVPQFLRRAIERDTDHDATREKVAEFLEGVLAGRRDPTMFRHPLDFLCLPLHRSDEYGLCVHAWLPDQDREPRDSTLTTSDIHLHTWKLNSRIMYGCVENTLITVTPESKRPDYRIFNIFKDERDEDVDVLKPTKETVLTSVIRTEQVPQGSQYSLDAHQYHKANEGVNGEPTITLLLATDWDDKPQRTLGALEQKGHPVRRERCPAEQVEQVAKVLLHHICA